MCSGDGIIVFLNKRILFNDGVDKKTNDGRTTWIVQRNEKNDRFFKSNGLKLLDIFTE